MLVFLASNAYITLNKILPLLPHTPRELKVAFIPTAGDLYEDKPWQESDKQALIKEGFEVEVVDIKEFTKIDLAKKLADKDVIFVAGGNTSYLLEKAQQSGFMEITRDMIKAGKVYIGSSAGALLAGPNIEVDKIYDDGEFGKVLESYEGLGLVPFVILPHADNPKYAPYLERIYKEYGDKYDLRKLNDNEALIIDDNKVETVVS